MKAAIIDVGSNSIRLLLGTYIDGQWYNEPKRLWTTRLGKRLWRRPLSCFCYKCRSRSIKWPCVYGASHDILLHDVSYLKW